MDSLLRVSTHPYGLSDQESISNGRLSPADWVEAHFYIPETDDHHLRLAPYQRAVLNEALRTGDDGKFVYSVVVWSDIKKSIKSTIAAAKDAYRAFNTEWGSFYVVANDLKQADSRVSYYLRRALELNPALGNRAKVRPSGYYIELDNHTRIESIPIDPKGEAGANPDGVTYSELWGANQKAAQRMWTETTLSPTKYGYSQRWVETYAGWSGESPILEQLYDSGVKQGRQLDLSYTDPDGIFHDLSDLEVYANDAARLLCLWNTVPRLSWQSADYYAQESAVLTPEEFDRVHRNQWGTSANKFIPIEWWDACQGELPDIRRSQPMVVALDAAVSNDCFGIVAVTRTDERVEVRKSRRWIPPAGGKLDYFNPNDPSDIEAPEGYLRWLIATYNVVCIVYDEYQLHDFCNRLSGEGLGWFEPFSQGAPRLVADKQLYDLIRERGMVHDGDADLREHIANANRTDEEDNKLRIIKRAPHMKIDLCVALSMAAYQAKYLNIG